MCSHSFSWRSDGLYYVVAACGGPPGGQTMGWGEEVGGRHAGARRRVAIDGSGREGEREGGSPGGGEVHGYGNIHCYNWDVHGRVRTRSRLANHSPERKPGSYVV